MEFAIISYTVVALVIGFIALYWGYRELKKRKHQHS